MIKLAENISYKLTLVCPIYVQSTFKNMKEFTNNLEHYIDQYDLENQLFLMGKEIKKRGYLVKDEFLSICLWKSRRPKNLYKLNSNETIIKKTKQAFKEIDELKKISALTDLKGISIPTASAILTVVDPQNYPIIDERCIQSLKNLKVIPWESISVKNWIEYLSIIRNLAFENNKTPRDIEKGLFAFNRIHLDKEYINLYKQVKTKEE